MSDDFENRTWEEIMASVRADDKYSYRTRSDVKLAAKYDFDLFYRHVLGFNADSPLIRELITIIQDPEKHSVSSKSNKFAYLAARGHSKTTTATIAGSLWIGYGGGPEKDPRGIEIMLSAATGDQSSDILERMKRIIKRNEALQHLEPDVNFIHEHPEASHIDSDEAKWAARSITLTTDVRIKIKPFNSGIRSKHIDYFFGDDLLSDEESGNKTREGEKNIFYSVITPIIENSGGTCIVVGTPQEPGDLMMELVYDKEMYHGGVYPAVVSDDAGEWQESMWPFMWTLEELKAKREEIGPARFEREYMCQPMSHEEQFFKDEIVQSATAQHEHWRPQMTEEYGEWQFYVAVDVALQDGDNADFTVFSVVGQDEEKNTYLVDVRREKGMTPSSIADELVNLDKKYGFARGLVEKNAIGEGVWKEVADRTELSGRIDSFDTTRKTRTKILSGLQAAINRQGILLYDYTPLIEELRHFRYRKGKLQGKDHDDCVMSLAICAHLIEDGEYVAPSLAIIGQDDEETDGEDDFELEEEVADIGVGIVGYSGD